MLRSMLARSSTPSGVAEVLFEDAEFGGGPGDEEVLETGGENDVKWYEGGVRPVEGGFEATGEGKTLKGPGSAL